MGETDDVADWKVPMQRLEGRVGVLERAFFGVLNEETNEYVPGLLQTTGQTAKGVAKLEGWVKIAAIVGIAFVMLVAFPKLFELVKVALSLGA